MEGGSLVDEGGCVVLIFFYVVLCEGEFEGVFGCGVWCV
jgi:hypothetical protein